MIDGAEIEPLADASLSELPHGYGLARAKGGLFAGRISLLPHGGSVCWTTDTSAHRLALVREAWMHYADHIKIEAKP